MSEIYSLKFDIKKLQAVLVFVQDLAKLDALTAKPRGGASYDQLEKLAAGVGVDRVTLGAMIYDLKYCGDIYEPKKGFYKIGVKTSTQETGVHFGPARAD